MIGPEVPSYKKIGHEVPRSSDQDMKFLNEYRKFEVPHYLYLIIIKAIRISVHKLLNKDQKFLISILKMV